MLRNGPVDASTHMDKIEKHTSGQPSKSDQIKINKQGLDLDNLVHLLYSTYLPLLFSHIF